MSLNQYYFHKLVAIESLLLFCLLLSFVALPVLASEDRVLSLNATVIRALENDSVVMLNQTRAQSAIENAIADGEMEDPRLTLGVFNVPTDNFDMDKNPTTQLRFGVKQALPRGDTLRYQSLKSRDLADASQAMALLVSKQIVRDVREQYLEAFYQGKVLGVLESNRRLFVRLLKNTEDNYSVGGSNQQAILQAKLEVSKLDDRISQALNKQESSKAILSKWVPEVMNSSLEDELPGFPELNISGDIQNQLANHPQIIIDNAYINAAKRGVLIAKEQYKPGVDLGIEYRQRFGDEVNGDGRQDLMAAMVTLDMPIFTENRQDRRLSASQFDLQSAKLVRDEHLRVLSQQLNRHVVDWQRLKDRELLYRQRLLPDAVENTEASLQAYQNRVIEFSTLIQAHITELETRISRWRVSVNKAKSHAELLYLSMASSEFKQGEAHE